jgi:hypothetical protein
MHEKKKKQATFKGSDCHDEWLFWLSTAESQTISSMAQSTPSHGAMVGDSFILHTVGRCPDTLVERGEDDDTTGAKRAVQSMQLNLATIPRPYSDH